LPDHLVRDLVLSLSSYVGLTAYFPHNIRLDLGLYHLDHFHDLLCPDFLYLGNSLICNYRLGL
jgi:hypothetical protein